MAISVNDTGTVITLDVEKVDIDDTVIGPTTLTPGVDGVNFLFKLANGTIVSKVGAFITGSKARYTTLLADVAVPGRCELQLQIDSPAWKGSTWPPLELDIGTQFVVTS